MPNAIVTGATQGIGRAIAEKLLSEGFSLAVCARSMEDLKKLESLWNETYPTASILVYPTDLSIKENAKAFANEALQFLTTLDILVNNAGLYFPGELATEPEGQLEQLMAINVFSAYHITRQVISTMRTANSGHVFNICSVASHKAYPNGGAYSITKYALQGFSDNLREELKHTSIKVTSISPGATDSRSWAGSGVEKSRIMAPSDIAKMLWAAYSLSPQATVENILIRPQKGDL